MQGKTQFANSFEKKESWEEKNLEILIITAII